MINKKLYISDRFMLIDYLNYKKEMLSFGLDEIVTADTELCKKRFSGLEFENIIIDNQIVFDFHKFRLNKNEQYIMQIEINESFEIKEFLEFEFCGIEDNETYIRYRRSSEFVMLIRGR